MKKNNILVFTNDSDKYTDADSLWNYLKLNIQGSEILDSNLELKK